MGQKAIVKRLLDAGADSNAKGNLAGSALRAALMMNYQNICQILLEEEANPNSIDRWYGTPLHEASMAGHDAMVNLLLESGANPNLRGGVFGTALVASAWQGNVKIVKSLLQKGAFLEGHENGKTALYMATVEKHDEIVKVLIVEADQKRARFAARHSPEDDSRNVGTPAKNSIGLGKKKPASWEFRRGTGNGFSRNIDSLTFRNSTNNVKEKAKVISEKAVEKVKEAPQKARQSQHNFFKLRNDPLTS